MSRRKSRTKSLFLDKSDMVFEDDSSDADAVFRSITETVKDDNKSDTSRNSAAAAEASVRISSRAKKQKNIYDPSEWNGPVHKKKKEALEVAQLLAAAKKSQSAISPSKSAPVQEKTTTKTPSKTPKKITKTSATVAKPQTIPKTASDVKKKLDLQEKPDSVETSRVPVAQAPVTILKVSKPLQQQQQPQTINVASKEMPKAKTIVVQKIKPLNDLRESEAKPLTSRERSASTSGNSEFEKASTVEMNGKKGPDVSKWTADDVYNYFLRHGFDKKDALKYKEQEIDGETLLILHRDDLKSLDLKVGTFVKMWNRILTLQTGSNDFSQSWK